MDHEAGTTLCVLKKWNSKVLFVTIRIAIRIENTYQAGAELLEVPPKS